MPDADKCKSCGAAILWATTTSGASTPLDAEPVPDGNTVLRDGKAQVLGTRNRIEPAAGELRYRSHFVTCPNAKQHRKAK